MVKVLVFVLVALTVILLLRQYRPEYAMLTAVSGGVILLLYLAKQVYEPISTLFNIMSSYGISSDLISYILKALGICLLTKFASELCNDFGQSSLSGKVEMAGKAAILIISMPIIQSILNTGLSLL